jgi:hypothetical protein
MNFEKKSSTDAVGAQVEQIDSTPSLERQLQGENLHFNARDGAALEHELTPLQAIKAYPNAIFWALMVSMCVVMVRKSIFFDGIGCLLGNRKDTTQS